ncbi:MAG: PAS domain S-box protein, partial [Candidatus Zixiibacteriota bacterium]
LFVLFLCSALVSLLTVYLISNRFKGPLDRLIHGFEKTAEGELFYLFEAHGDVELKKLAAAFNRMSEALWRNHKKLKRSNYNLAKANRASLESQLFLATLIDSSPSCVVTADSQGRIMIFNRKASEDFGYDKEDAIGKNVDKLLTNAVRESQLYQPPGTGQSGVEVLCRRRDGSTFPAYLIVSPIMTKEGSITAYLYIIRDISESKNFQQMMVRIDRYYTRGEMASEVAHEINNYLAVLSGNIELLPLMWGKGDQDRFHHRLEVMKQTVDKIARFSDGLMDTDPDKSAFEPADINQLVENTVAFLKPQNRFDNVEITTTLSPHLSLVEIDVAQIQQLLVNLLYNAAEALQDRPGRKKIGITTSVAGEGSAKSVQIEIRDNGPGVAEDKKEQLFTKRFTTKRKGHGIGLITCRKIVEAHNGRIAYRKEEGATFRFDVPIKRQEATDSSTAEAVAQQSSQPA